MPTHKVRGSLLSRMGQVVVQDTWTLHPRLRLAGLAFALMPRMCANRVRTWLYRVLGIRIGYGSLVLGTMELAGRGRVWERLVIGAECQVTTPFFADLNDTITLGDHVAVAHHVVLITTTHTLGPPQHRAGQGRTAPIVLGSGCWIGAGAMILPGVTVGAGSVVAAGAVVCADVPPNTLVGGVPARILRRLDGSDRPDEEGMAAGLHAPDAQTLAGSGLQP